jgi:outer membrane protein assembly factor BamB
MDAKTGHILWTFQAGGEVKSGLSTADGRLFFGDYSSTMYALRISSGKLLWRTHTAGLSSGYRSGSFYSTPSVDYGRVYIGNTDGKLYSFVASTGQIAWTHSFGSWVYGSPAVHNGLVFETGYAGVVEALNARTGNVQWQHTLPYRTTASPTVIGDYVYVGGHGGTKGNLWAYNPGNGKQVWHFPDGLYSTVIAAGDNHLVVAGRTTLYMLRARG